MTEAELDAIKARAEKLVGNAEPKLTPDQTYQDIQALIAAVRRYQATITVITSERNGALARNDEFVDEIDRLRAVIRRAQAWAVAHGILLQLPMGEETDLMNQLLAILDGGDA